MKCKYTKKFSFSAFFKTMANFWRVTLKTAAPSEPPTYVHGTGLENQFKRQIFTVYVSKNCWKVQLTV